MQRREFLQQASAGIASLVLGSGASTYASTSSGESQVMTVLGPVNASDMGITLTHEHLLADFRWQSEKTTNPRPYDRAEVARVVLPHLKRIQEFGCRTFVDCTAVFLGRDAALLKRISEASRMHILTVTGNYAALGLRALPCYVLTDTVDELAQRWISEWQHGIDGTDIRPGFIKLGFEGGPLTDVEEKLIRAAAIAHLQTGLTVGSHISGPNSFLKSQGIRSWAAESAFKQMAILEDAGVDLSAWIWIHSQNESDPSRLIEAARRGAWISFDGIGGEDSIQHYVERVMLFRSHGMLNRVHISQDAGWYWVGEPGGGKIRPYDTLFTSFLPELRKAGLTQTEIDMLLVQNPADAFSVRVRRRHTN